MKRYEEGKVSFANVEVFSIDEYYPAPAKSQSRNRRLYSEFLEKVDVDMANVHIPSFENVVETTAVTEYCAEFDRKATGLDFLVMGIGSHGEVGFN